MTARAPHEDTFEAHRGRLMALAYRMTGSLVDSEDAVQEAYLRWEATDLATVRNPHAFLSTTVTRLCLDMLKSARVRRESYVGPWLPEPVLDAKPLHAEEATELAEDISVALMLALERLSPLERAAFLLHEVFDWGYDEVAQTLGRTEAACRQLVSRAKKHVRAARPRYQPSPDECERLVVAFETAVRKGDLAELEATLAEDATLYTDGGGKALSALRPIQGANAIARFFVGIVKKNPIASTTEIRPELVNGAPGFVVVEEGKITQTMAFDIREGAIQAVYAVRNPDKLARLGGHGPA